MGFTNVRAGTQISCSRIADRDTLDDGAGLLAGSVGEDGAAAVAEPRLWLSSAGRAAPPKVTHHGALSRACARVRADHADTQDRAAASAAGADDGVCCLRAVHVRRCCMLASLLLHVLLPSAGVKLGPKATQEAQIWNLDMQKNVDAKNVIDANQHFFTVCFDSRRSPTPIPRRQSAGCGSA